MSTFGSPSGEPGTDTELEHFLSRYREEGRTIDDRVPDLQDSLAVITETPAGVEALRGLPCRSRALIEGYASLGNADALRRCLLLAGVQDTDVVAIDLVDTIAAYAKLGFTLPRMDFVQADACQLSGVATDGEFDVIVQDFLLNCVACNQVPELLAEAGRVLSAGGRFIISFTDCSGLASQRILTPSQVESDWGLRWDDKATHFSQIVSEPALRQELLGSLAGSVVYDQANDQYAAITAPFGRFEFFVPQVVTLRRLDEAGFRVLYATENHGRDDNGFDCMRHRLVACHR